MNEKLLRIGKMYFIYVAVTKRGCIGDERKISLLGLQFDLKILLTAFLPAKGAQLLGRGLACLTLD